MFNLQRFNLSKNVFGFRLKDKVIVLPKRKFQISCRKLNASLSNSSSIQTNSAGSDSGLSSGLGSGSGSGSVSSVSVLSDISKMTSLDMTDVPDSSAALFEDDAFLEVVGSGKNENVGDVEYIFKEVWESLIAKYGEENLSFPKDMVFLAGAPGAGKGAMTSVILQNRGISSKPIEVSSLLNSPEAVNLKAAGKLVGDKQVIELLFETLLKPEYQSGVLIDGFPRTREQAECMKILYDKMMVLRRNNSDSAHYDRFPRPIFHIICLYIDQKESVKRQLHRGTVAAAHNEVVKATGVGELIPIRGTDIDANLAAVRYEQFKSQVYEALQIVKQKFHFHLIEADGSPSEVQERLIKELRYQSSMELSDETFELIRKLPLASEVIVNARHDLVSRLDGYALRQGTLFRAVISAIQNEFMHIIRRQALAGIAIIRSTTPVFFETGAIAMALDILSERGYIVSLDFSREKIPDRVDVKTGQITFKEHRVLEFQIKWTRPAIRRG